MPTSLFDNERLELFSLVVVDCGDGVIITSLDLVRRGLSLLLVNEVVGNAPTELASVSEFGDNGGNP